MPQNLRENRFEVSPLLLRLDNLTAYIRGDSSYYKPFPGREWFTPSRMSVIHSKMLRVHRCVLAKATTLDAKTSMDAEVYYLALLAKYQFEGWGGDIGPVGLNQSRRPVRRPRHLTDWYTLLDFLTDRMFYWSKQHRINVVQIEAMMRVWLVVRYHHRKLREIGSLPYANNMCPPRSVSKRRKPDSRRSSRRSV